jgi:hypothetical protein
MTTHQIIAYVGQAILLVNTFVYFKGYSKNGVTFKIFSVYLTAMLIIQIFTSLIFEIGRINIHIFSGRGNNLFLSHFYFILQFFFLSIFFFRLVKYRFQKKFILLTLILVFSLLVGYYVKYPKDYYSFNVFEIAVTSVPLIIYSLMVLIQKFEGSGRFLYITSGFFLYIVCSTLLFTTGNISADLKSVIWYLNNILYVAYQILIFIEWYKHFRKKEVIS